MEKKSIRPTLKTEVNVNDTRGQFLDRGIVVGQTYSYPVYYDIATKTDLLINIPESRVYV